MFTHQEKILSAFPLCTAWLDFKPGSDDKGAHHNFIYDLDLSPLSCALLIFVFDQAS